MSGYVKLFGSIIHSTIWREPDHIRLVWITMLAMADKEGVVMASVPGLADASRVSLPLCEAALERLSAPDPYSRCTDREGRRIGRIDGGWAIYSYAHYRGQLTADKVREQTRERVARHAEKKRQQNQQDVVKVSTNATNADSVSTNATNADSVSTNATNAINAHAAPDPAPDLDPPEAGGSMGVYQYSGVSTDLWDLPLVAATVPHTDQTPKSTSKLIRQDPPYGRDFEDWYATYPNKVGKRAAWKEWRRLGTIKALPAVELMIAAVDRQIHSEQWQRGYIPHPKTWLHQGRWADQGMCVLGRKDSMTPSERLMRQNEQYLRAAHKSCAEREKTNDDRNSGWSNSEGDGADQQGVRGKDDPDARGD